MANFDWVPDELNGRFSYVNGKLVASCEICGATKTTSGRGSVIRDIELGKIDRFRLCSIHGDFGHAKPSQEDIASWPEGHKRCRRCLYVKPFSEFHKHKTSLMGYAVECKECRIPASKAQYKSQTFEQTMLYSSRYRAKESGVPHTITIDDIIIPERCPILGVKLVLERNHQFAPSLDQVHPGAGYTPDNIIVMSLRANKIKNDITAHEAKMLYEWMWANSPDPTVFRNCLSWDYSRF